MKNSKLKIYWRAVLLALFFILHSSFCLAAVPRILNNFATTNSPTQLSNIVAAIAVDAVPGGVTLNETTNAAITVANQATNTLRAPALIGTLPDATFPATLPAASGANLTALNASAIASGTVPPARMPTPFAQMSRARTNTFNVLDYGADPTGIAMSDLAFQSAINDAHTNGGVVLVPPGRFGFSGTQPDTTYSAEGHMSVLNIRSNNVTIRGAGKRETIFFVSTLPTAPAGDGNWNFFGSTNSVGITNLVLEDFTLDTASHVLLVDMTQFYRAYDVVIRNVLFKNCLDGDAVDTQHGGTVVVEGCEFYNIGGNCLSSQDNQFLVRNCIGKGTGFGLEFRSIDGGQSPASVLQTYANLTKMTDCVFTDFSVALDSVGAQVFIENCYFAPTNITAITNFWVGSGFTKVANSTVNSSYNFSSGFIFAVTTNRQFELNNCSIQGKRAIFADFPTENSLAIRNNKFGSTQPNEGSVITLSGAHGALIENNVFYGNGYRGVDLFVGPQPSHNVQIRGNTFRWSNILLYGLACTNAMITGNMFHSAVTEIAGGSGHLFEGNSHLGQKLIVSYADGVVVRNNLLQSLEIQAARATIYENNRLFTTTPVATPDQINAAVWIGNTDQNHVPLQSTTRTANYTNNAIDGVVIFNGSNLTNTIPSAVTLNKRKSFTIKNLHSTALEVTNATGAQTFDGALRFSIPQYGSRTIISDGVNWQTISSHTP
jgi:hypothetical protein